MIKHAPIKVTVTDPATGEVLGEQILDNDYLVICHGKTYNDSVQRYGNGTHVVTIKDAP